MDSTKYKLRTVALFLCFFTGLSPAFSSMSRSIQSISLPSTVFARRILSDSITGSYESADSLLPDVYIDLVNEHVINFFTEDTRKEIHFYFSLDPGMEFKNVKKGSCEIIRSNSAGGDRGVLEVRFYIKDDSGSFVRITPDKQSDESLLSIYLYGFLMQKDVKVPLTIDSIVSASFNEIEELTSAYVNWGFYLPDPRAIYSDDVIRLSNRILPLLNFLNDADDGAMDKDGNYVFIDTLKKQTGDEGLNCSGFAKWVIDGLYYLKKGTYIDLERLKKKHNGIRGNVWSKKLEDKYDPYFGLDWIRNLAYILAQSTNPEVRYDAFDITDLMFHSYVKDIGFPLKDLKTVLYELAVTKPEYFYLGSINMVTDDPPGLRKHLHVVVIFPYVDSLGKFSFSILSRNKEVSIAELKKNYPDSFIDLVRIKADTHFDPPGMRFDPTIRRLF